MKLNVKALGLAFALIGGGCLFFVGLGNLIWPGYGTALLELAASVYPGYNAGPSLGQVILGTLYGLVDWFIAGLIVAWLYNAFAAATAGTS